MKGGDNMRFSEDYTFIKQYTELIQLGFASVSVHHFDFDRYCDPFAKHINRDADPQGWQEEADRVWGEWREQCYKMLDELSKKYKIYQYDPSAKYNEHDLFFWSNKGWNGGEMTGFSLNPVDGLNIENFKVELAKYTDNITCRTQYHATVNDKLLDAYVDNNIKCDFIFDSSCYGRGKVRYLETQNQYVFMRKGAKKYGYVLDNVDLFRMIQEQKTA